MAQAQQPQGLHSLSTIMSRRAGPLGSSGWSQSIASHRTCELLANVQLSPRASRTSLSRSSRSALQPRSVPRPDLSTTLSPALWLRAPLRRSAAVREAVEHPVLRQVGRLQHTLHDGRYATEELDVVGHNKLNGLRHAPAAHEDGLDARGVLRDEAAAQRRNVEQGRSHQMTWLLGRGRVHQLHDLIKTPPGARAVRPSACSSRQAVAHDRRRLEPQGSPAPDSMPAPGAAPAAPPPPPPAPAAPTPSSGGSGGGGGGHAALLASLNKGGAITSGLKKVDPSQQMHKNPELRAAGTVPERSVSPSKRQGPPVKAKPAGFSRAPAAPAKKPPKLELEGNKWAVDNQEDARNLEIKDTALHHTVHLFNCKNTVLRVHGKINALTMVNCMKTSVVLESVVSSVSVTSSPSFEVQITGMCPTVQVDTTDSGNIFLSKECMDTVEVVTSKTSALNISIPAGEDGDFVERPVPEQMRSRVVDGKLVTEIVEHAESVSLVKLRRKLTPAPLKLERAASQSSGKERRPGGTRELQALRKPIEHDSTDYADPQQQKTVRCHGLADRAGSSGIGKLRSYPLAFAAANDNSSGAGRLGREIVDGGNGERHTRAESFC
ncbi:adenylyl cyclase-associated protein [Trichosporon asahii var. asahii CBS 2479]|uniref:Adenylyl cyclase-associated protein n=1 Tax=Trichosporon asahii var. asahii (strain ATCC 90039 / CBS 2479 / JCM 2466 / KCTC 7840 / NBRC 103889/ NCYC 2677 / UAMH 7654) TaxID=1186058 RepID=J6F5I6_TRIAS|nr:adenylyl cyclase-associated protein [Trichosporon asahii var. asahii CBS 2479]EJT50537.1 adenylyl cyclase-associated protein [Trichosporon asahii var. asahii CBS 2479]